MFICLQMITNNYIMSDTSREMSVTCKTMWRLVAEHIYCPFT